MLIKNPHHKCKKYLKNNSKKKKVNQDSHICLFTISLLIGCETSLGKICCSETEVVFKQPPAFTMDVQQNKHLFLQKG